MSDRQMQPGSIGLIISAITGPPTLFWAAITGDFMPVFSGACMGVAGLGWWIYSQPQKRAVEELMKIQVLQREAEERQAAERLKLRMENEELRVQLVRLMGEVKGKVNEVKIDVARVASGNTAEMPVFRPPGDK